MFDTEPNSRDELTEQNQVASDQPSASNERLSEAPASDASRLKSLERERDTLLDRLARTQADFENSRRRMEREQQDYRDFALADAMRILLPSVDSLDWALQSPVETVEDFRSGVKLVRQQLQNALEKLGVSLINAKGEAFDPRFHEAVDLVEFPDTAPNTVVEELRPGYKLGERLLRPAMVLVAGGTNPKSD
jgi:molecular chaperone GrpE